VGLAETIGAAGGEISCANPGISSASLLIDRPWVFPFSGVEEWPPPGLASGIVPVDTVPVAVEPEVVAEDGMRLMVARGVAAPTLLTVLLSDDGSLDSEVVLMLCGDGRGVGNELAGEEVDGECSTDAMGGFCGFRISWCGLRGAILSIRRPLVPVLLVSWLIDPVSCWAETEGIG
jgi:hypothetical protein